MSVPNAAAPAGAPAPAPQSNDEAISQYASGFLRDLESNDNPESLDPNEAPEVEAPPQSEPEAPEVEQEAETPAQPEIPLVEVELDDGEKVLVPEKVKHRMMADKDYRQKTMALSAEKKQVEQMTAKVAEITQQAQQLAPYYAQLHQMDSRANYLQRALQSPELAADPLAFNSAQSELAILLHNRTQFANGLEQQQSQLTQQQNQLRAQQLALEAPKLFETFPDLQKPETQQKLAEYVRSEGLPQEAIDFLNYSAAGVKLAHKARLYDEMVAEQARSRAKLKETVKTLPPATSSSRAADSGAKDKSLRETWKKNGGNINDPAFSELLRSKIRSK